MGALVICQSCGKTFFRSIGDNVKAAKAIRIEDMINPEKERALQLPKECPECRQKEARDGG